MGILKIIFDFATTAISWMKEKGQARHELEMATLNTKKEIVISREQANTEWELAQLSDKDKGLRWAAFVLFASPLLAHWISPTFGQYIQDGWNRMQLWQANVLAGMALAVFGIRTIPRLIGASVSAFVDAIKKPKLPPPDFTKKQ